MHPQINPAPAAHPFSVDDFLTFGQRYGIRYRFPNLPLKHRQTRTPTIIQGRVRQIHLAYDLQLTYSDIEVLEAYETTSLRQAPLLIMLVLEGSIRIHDQRQCHQMGAGDALTLRLEQPSALRAEHAPGQRLKTLTLALDPDSRVDNPALHPLLQDLLSTSVSRRWHLPPAMLDQMASYLATESLPPILLDGLALQLLGHDQLCRQQYLASAAVRDQGLARLELVREQIRRAPERDYRLSELAGLAAMSSSSLRTRFRQVYGQSVFEYLRECRLRLARRYLECGNSVQQAAHLAGYRHASNLATAFRRRYGLPPSAVRGKSGIAHT